MEKTYRLWKHVELNEIWLNCDTSSLDDISSSWFERRKKLKEDSGEYADFLNKLKREHAIETGIIERLYDLKKGITETFINEGFVKSFLSHGDTNIPEDDLIAHLNDHLDSVNFIFDIVKENRPLSTSFIKELHQLVTRNQKYAEGRDQFGQKLQIDLLKGQYKTRENNPTREDGTKILYCSPDHVSSEMDNLISIYNTNSNSIHPLILSTWFHHMFTIIHPFQDGNGRIARLLTSLIFIKNGYFPFTVLREEAKVKYIEALEKADNGEPQSLITYFGEVQKRNIQKALNLKDVSSTSLVEVQNIFATKIAKWKNQKVQEHELKLVSGRNDIFNYSSFVLNLLMNDLKEKLNGNINVSIASCSFENQNNQHFFYQQIIGYAKKHDYFFNSSLPKAWLMFKIDMEENKRYQLGISIHHYGYDDNTIAIGSFVEFKGEKMDDKMDTTIPLDIPPHVISISENFEGKKKNIREYLENALTITLAQIASEI
jgi:Fic family protein